MIFKTSACKKPSTDRKDHFSKWGTAFEESVSAKGNFKVAPRGLHTSFKQELAHNIALCDFCKDIRNTLKPVFTKRRVDSLANTQGVL